VADGFLNAATNHTIFVISKPKQEIITPIMEDKFPEKSSNPNKNRAGISKRVLAAISSPMLQKAAITNFMKWTPAI
jgi:hypothetical protein